MTVQPRVDVGPVLPCLSSPTLLWHTRSAGGTVAADTDRRRPSLALDFGRALSPCSPFLPARSRAIFEMLVRKTTYLSYFPKQGRANLVNAMPSDGGNALTKVNLVSALGLFEEISAISATYEVS